MADSTASAGSGGGVGLFMLVTGLASPDTVLSTPTHSRSTTAPPRVCGSPGFSPD
ncbi:MAG: hypothetical protein ACLGIF_01165 [Actinomycetes bacterium]